MARARSRWAFVAVAVAAGAARASSGRAADESTGLDPTALEEANGAPGAPLDEDGLRRRIAEIVAAGRAMGAAVAVVASDGRSFSAGFGAADEGVAMDAATLFRVGSLTKSFLALAVLRLVEQGKLRLEDRVRDLIPEIAVENPWERSRPLLVAHLLEHTAGFDEMRFNEIFDPDGREDRPLREVLARNPRSRVARWPPGTRYSYSQPGYTTLGAIVQKVSGMPFEQFLEEQVFRPLGIAGARLRATADVPARLAAGHEHGRRTGYPAFLHRPALNLMISAQDLAPLLQMLLARGMTPRGRFLTAASIDRIERCETLPYGPPTVRYGLGNWGDVSSRLPLRGHGGMMPGYLAFYRYSRERRFGYAVLINDVAAGKVSRRISEAILDHLLAGTPPPAPPTAPVAPDELAGYAGHYQLRSPHIEFARFHSDVYEGISLERDGGALWVTFPERAPLPLLPTGPRRFRLPGQSDSSVELLRSPEGRRAVVIGGQYFEEESALLAWARRAALELSLFLLGTTLIAPLLVLARRRPQEKRLLLAPLLATLCLWGMSHAFDQARATAALGACAGVTVAVWVLSWAFALASQAAFGRAVRGLAEPTPAILRAYALVTGAAAVWITLHLSRYGLIGLRTWRW